MKTLEEIKEAEKRAEETLKRAEEKRQEILKKAQLDAEQIELEGRKALKEKLAKMHRDEDEKIDSERKNTLEQASKKAAEMKKTATKNAGTAVNLVLEKFEEEFS